MFVKQGLAYLLSAAVAAGLVAVDLRILTSPDVAAPKIRRLLEGQLGGSVTLGEVDLQEVGVFRCRNLRIRPPAHLGAEDEIRFESVQVEYTGVLPASIRPTQVRIDGLTVRAGRPALAYWVKRLSASSGDTPLALPVIRIEQARVHIDLPEVFAAGERLQLEEARLSIQPLDGGAILADLSTGSGLGGAWSIRAEYLPADDEVRVEARCPGLDIREAFARRLKPELFAIWDRYRIEGPVRVEARATVGVPPSGHVSVSDWSVRAGFTRSPDREVSGRFKPFPYPVRGLEGEVDFLPAGVRIHGVRGQTAEGTAFLRGTSSGYPADSAYDIHVRLDRLRLDDTLREAAPPEFQSIWRELNLSGLVDAEVQVTREEGPDRPERYQAVLHATDAAMRHTAFPYAITGIRGEVFYNNGEVLLRHLDGTHGAARVSLSGRLAAIDKPGGISLEVEALDVPFDEDLHAAVLPDIRPIWEALAPTGRADLLWRLTQEAGAGAPLRHRLEVRCRGAAGLVYREFPLPLANLRGVAVYDGTSLEIQYLQGTYRDAPVTLRGSVRQTGPSTAVRLQVTTERLSVDDGFRADIPGTHRELADQLGLRGRVDAEVRLAYRRVGDGPLIGSYTAEVHLHDASLEDRFPITRIHGRVSLEGEIQPGGYSSAGVFKITQARFAGKHITDLGAHYRFADGRLCFFDVRGTAYDGIVHIPFFEADAATGRYEGRGRLEAVDIALFARDTIVAGRPLAGRLSGEIEFSGSSGDLATLRGKGRLEIVDGNLWEVPLFLQLMRVLNLGPLPAQEMFHSGSVRFRVADQRVWLDDFLFHSDSVTLSGSGWVKFDGKIDLLIDTEFSTAILSEIPGLNELFNILKRNIVAVRARGTFTEPKLRLKMLPLKDFTAEPDDDTK
jgi:hypothetical protein